MGNPDLWFAVLWLVVEDGKLPFLADILPRIREHMLFRLRNSLAPASLTEQPHFVSFQIPLGAACWFCLASCLAPENCTQDAIRMHMRHTRPLFKLCELAGYHVPEAVQTYNKRLRVLFTLRLMAAHSFNRFRSLMLALYQKVIFIHDPSHNVKNFAGIVPVDGPADEAQIEKVLEILLKYCRDISIEEVIGIGALITSPSVSIKNIDLSVHWQPPPIPDAAVFWKHYDDNINATNLPNYTICPATMHPYYTVPGSDTSWRV